MKAFVLALAAIAVISVASGAVLTMTDLSAGERFSSDAVRLGD
jgi:hypothetical protein